MAYRKESPGRTMQAVLFAAKEPASEKSSARVRGAPRVGVRCFCAAVYA